MRSALQPDGTRRGEYRFYTANSTLVERRNQPDYRFDPRQRPWYVAVAGTGGLGIRAGVGIGIGRGVMRHGIHGRCL